MLPYGVGQDSECSQRGLSFKESNSHMFKRQRPYHVERTASRPISEVKQRWVWLVLGWVTAWEHQMLLAFNNFFIVFN